MSDQNSESSSSREIRIFGLVPDSIVDGPGLRFTVFVQGCPHACRGCHNPESHDPNGGHAYSLDSVYEKIRQDKLASGVTFSGGEPFCQPEACCALAERLRADGYDLWAYSGFLYEDLMRMSEQSPAIKRFLELLDVLVDGPFIESKQSLELQWRGSSNQRVIDLARTRDAGSIVEWKEDRMTFELPSNW